MDLKRILNPLEPAALSHAHAPSAAPSSLSMTGHVQDSPLCSPDRSTRKEPTIPSIPYSKTLVQNPPIHTAGTEYRTEDLDNQAFGEKENSDFDENFEMGSNLPLREHDEAALPSSPSRSGSPIVIAAIEDMVGNIMESLQAQEELCIELKSRRQLNLVAGVGEIQDHSLYKIRFPARTPEEAWRFTVVLRILELMHEALTNNVVVSKRNIYYADPSLFKSQSVVDRYIDILAYTLGVQRADLNVTAAAKGLVVGDFKMSYSDLKMIEHKAEMDVVLIPDAHSIVAVDSEEASWILVVEKESTFRTLASGKFHTKARAGKGIVLTAKGYPDISTRAFLRLLSNASVSNRPPPPIFALVDFDPYGIAIMSTYKHGSQNLAHENASLNVPDIRWLGLRNQDALTADPREGLLRLSMRDRKKAVDMLQKSDFDEDGPEQEGRRELQVMLMLGVKAEMEILANREGGVGKWVEDRLIDELNDAEEVMDV